MRFGMSKKYIAHVVLLSGAVLIAACGGTVAFQGTQALAVTGTPPAPPPPPPPAPPPPAPEPPPRVELRDNKIEIHEKIQFAVNKATILEASFSLLDEIADVIKKATNARKIAIEGHASAEGDKNLNLKLSDARSKAVMKYLVDHGIEKDRLTATGFGSAKPIAGNDTEEGREKNRRVEFNIIEQAVTQKKIEIDTKTGKEKVVEEKHVVEKKEDAAAPEAAAADKKPAAASKKPAVAKPAAVTAAPKAPAAALTSPVAPAK